jgi:hypothetical protein
LSDTFFVEKTEWISIEGNLAPIPFMEVEPVKRPPLPTNKPAMHSRRLEQNLTCLAPSVSGAVLPPVTSTIQHSGSWLRVKRSDVLVKNVRISSFTPTFPFPFTHVTG